MDHGDEPELPGETRTGTTLTEKPQSEIPGTRSNQTYESGNRVTLEWSKRLGDMDGDTANCIEQTSDGGFIIAGEVLVYDSMQRDVLLMKTDADGDLVWTREFGGDDFDMGYSVIETSDGNFVVAGETSSYGAGGEDDYGHASSDAWMIKVDRDGEKLWDTTFGNKDLDEYARDVIELDDGSYIVVGSSFIDYDDFWDVLILKVDTKGSIIWSKRLGDETGEHGHTIIKTAEGGYLVGGYDYVSTGTYINGMLMKLDSDFDIEWVEDYGIDYYEDCQSVVQTPGGGYVFTGRYMPQGDDDELWVVKTDSLGKKMWSKTFGGSGGDSGHSVISPVFGGYLIAGETTITDQDKRDLWLLRLNEDGNQLYQKTLGPEGALNGANSVIQTSDDGYVAVGYDSSTYQYDVLIVKYRYLNEPPVCSIGYPLEGEVYSGVVKVGGVTSDLEGRIDLVEIKIDDGNWLTAQGLEEWSMFVDTTAIDDGDHTIFARAFDGKNHSEIEKLEISVNNLPPDCSIDEPSPDTELNGAVELQGTATSEGAEVMGVEIKIDDFQWKVASGTNSWKYNFNTSLYENGEHRIFIRSYDGEMYSDIENFTVIIKNDEPDVNGNGNDPPIGISSQLERNWFIIVAVVVLIIMIIIAVVFLISRSRKTQPPGPGSRGLQPQPPYSPGYQQHYQPQYSQQPGQYPQQYPGPPPPEDPDQEIQQPPADLYQEPEPDSYLPTRSKQVIDGTPGSDQASSPYPTYPPYNRPPKQ